MINLLDDVALASAFAASSHSSHQVVPVIEGAMNEREWGMGAADQRQGPLLESSRLKSPGPFAPGQRLITFHKPSSWPHCRG